jgi:hypothetical protein
MALFQKDLGVVDLETLGMGSETVILGLGLTLGRYDTPLTFDQMVSEGLYLKFNVKEQLARGRKTSERVVKWWYQQSKEAQEILRPRPDDVSLYDIDKYLLEFFKKRGLESIHFCDLYDRNCFDLSKIQYLYEEDLKRDVPWNYHNTFDIPTAFRFMGFERYAGVKVEDVPGCVYHNPLHDAALDHLRLYNVLHSEPKS